MLHNWDLEQGVSSQPLFQMLLSQAKITQIKHIWFTFKRKSCYFLHKGNCFSQWDLSWYKSCIPSTFFGFFPLDPGNKSPQIQEGPETNGKKHAVAVLQSNSLIYAMLLGSRLQSMLSGKHKLTIRLDAWHSWWQAACSSTRAEIPPGPWGWRTEEKGKLGTCCLKDKTRARLPKGSPGRDPDMQACWLCPTISPWLVG